MIRPVIVVLLLTMPALGQAGGQGGGLAPTIQQQIDRESKRLSSFEDRISKLEADNKALREQLDKNFDPPIRPPTVERAR